MHLYRNDETSVFHGAGAPTNHVDRPSIYVDSVTGSIYTNRGGGTNWALFIGGSGGNVVAADLVDGHSYEVVFVNGVVSSRQIA